MEKLYQFIIELIQTKLTWLKIILRSKLIARSKPHFDRADKALLLGNGPSIKQDIVAIKEIDRSGIDLFCLNKFPDTEFFELLQPKHFVIVSEEYWKPGTLEEYNIVRAKIMEALIRKTTWELIVHLPYGAKTNKDFIASILSNKNLKISYFNTTPVEGIKSMNYFFFKMGWGMPRPHNVLIPTIMNAMQCGYKQIGILGADHTWLETLSVNENNEALLNQKHFYDEGKTKSKKMTLRGSDYRKLHEILHKFMLTFKAYHEIRAYAQSRRIKVYNCTKKSFIDGLDRLPFSDFLKL